MLALALTEQYGAGGTRMVDELTGNRLVEVSDSEHLFRIQGGEHLLVPDGGALRRERAIV
jgi:hypothetical protein